MQLDTKAHHVFTRYYDMEEEYKEWIRSYPFPLNDLKTMKELNTNWMEIVYGSIYELLR